MADEGAQDYRAFPSGAASEGKDNRHGACEAVARASPSVFIGVLEETPIGIGSGGHCVSLDTEDSGAVVMLTSQRNVRLRRRCCALKPAGPREKLEPTAVITRHSPEAAPARGRVRRSRWRDRGTRGAQRKKGDREQS